MFRKAKPYNSRGSPKSGWKMKAREGIWGVRSRGTGHAYLNGGKDRGGKCLGGIGVERYGDDLTGNDGN